MPTRLNAYARILIVDDEPDICAELLEGLNLEGFFVCSVGSYQEAHDILLKAHAVAGHWLDALCLDLQLGAWSGLRLMEDINRLWSDGDRPVVIVVSGDYSGLALQNATELGASAVLTKPFKMADLADAVDQAISRRDLTGYWRSTPPPARA
jgi:DNA-binding response OmpR family regulator